MQRMNPEKRKARDEFMRRLKEEWSLLWTERFDDRVKAEGISIRDYPLLFMDRGFIIFASKDAKSPSFSEIVEFWASQGLVYTPDPAVGGWGKFARNFIIGSSRKRRTAESANSPSKRCRKQQLKKGGRGWLHIE
ncbi:MAG: hypothetical protein QXH37_00650 [Candidatus Bathyarchaeia archaeon]